MDSVQSIKQRFEIIGNDVKLNRAIEKAIQVAPTDISVLVTGESGVGKESIRLLIVFRVPYGFTDKGGRGTFVDFYVHKIAYFIMFLWKNHNGIL